MKSILCKIIVLIIAAYSISFAANELTIKDNNSNGSKPGYIQKATLVVEPFGGYVEQSLYLEYTDNNQFTANKLEIVHRFELPSDAVVNDLWLWIGDSVMQAKMFDTWSAREIYDSIVAAKYDPAFLAKNGTQYELKVYPLTPGSYRKIKLTFIVPTKWYGNQATAELPLEMLMASNSSKKPLEILFRTQKDIWGEPAVAESPNSKFIELTDTLNYKYKQLVLDDISSFASLNLKFNTEFSDGYFISGYEDKSDSTFFQLGILPEDFFNVTADLSPHNILVALDFSGSTRKDLTNKLPLYRSLIENSLKYNDNFKLLVSGNENIVDYTNSFVSASSVNINTAFDEFENSDHAKAINQYYTPNVLLCDGQASTNWSFTNLSSIANITIKSSMQDAINSITKADVVAAYDHGFETPLDDVTAAKVEASLDSLFAYGGRFLTYYDYNRVNPEKLAKHYITGLNVKAVAHGAVTLYRNINGNIGKDFPESFTRNASYFFEFNDPDVKVELQDAAGNPAVISKKIGNGLIVVSGIWSLNDDGAMKTLLGAPLLGVNSSRNPYTLKTFLKRILDEYQTKNFSRVIILSDSDSLITKSDAEHLAETFVRSYVGKFPRFFTVNILDNDIVTPGYIVDGQTEYYGSGYFLKKIADESNGVHFEKHMYDWPYIKSVLSPYSLPVLDELNIKTTVDGKVDTTLTLREVNKLSDTNKPRFFLGKANAHSLIEFNITGKFEGADTDSFKQFSFLVPHDSTTTNKLVKTMLGNEEINDLFYETPIDTAQVVQLSLLYNLLTDYTALLALEPDDEFHFMEDPLDEGDLSDVEEENNDDSTEVSVYPNPFNSMTRIKMNIKSISNVKASIYNILGQKVKEIVNEDGISGERVYTWNGKNNYGATVSSGFYIFRVVVVDNATRKEKVFTHKLVYLK